MRSSTAVGLLLASSMSIFGVYHAHARNRALPPGPEPVWVNGQMGVYDPDTGQFVPSTSPQFDRTCGVIRQRRLEASTRPSYGNSGYYPGTSHYGYGGGYGSHFYYGTRGFGGFGGGGGGGASGARTYTDDVSNGSAHSAGFGSARGGIGATGHGMGGSHA